MAVATNKSAVPSAAQRRADDETAGPVPEFSKEQDLAAFRDMLLIRRFEEKAGQLYGMGLIGASAISISARRRSSSACR